MQIVSSLQVNEVCTESHSHDADMHGPASLGKNIKGCVERRVSVHEHVFLEGEYQTHIYLVTKGVIGTYKLLSDGRRQVCTFAYPGEVLGVECAGQHLNNAEALCESVVRSIPSNAIEGLIMSEPGFGQTLLSITAMELAKTKEQLLSLGRKTAAEKLATFLLSIARRIDNSGHFKIQIELPMKRSDIADHLGLTVETVSRHFTRLKQAGVIELLSSSQVCIKNVYILEALAKGVDLPDKYNNSFARLADYSGPLS